MIHLPIRVDLKSFEIIRVIYFTVHDSCTSAFNALTEDIARWAPPLPGKKPRAFGARLRRRLISMSKAG